MRQTLAYVALLCVLLSNLARAENVNSKDYRAFWLWAGVRPQSILDDAERIYILQAEVEDGSPPRLVSRRSSVPRVQRADVWLVIRTETLGWPEGIYEQLMRQLATWRASGNRVVGLQIDFDAKTRHLARYTDFLRQLRARLPSNCKLGITGLLDWSASGDTAALSALAGVVDETVLQIYQGRRVIPGYRSYLERLSRLTIPFRIGLLQNGDWQSPVSLASNPFFRGYVVFLRND